MTKNQFSSSFSGLGDSSNGKLLANSLNTDSPPIIQPRLNTTTAVPTIAATGIEFAKSCCTKSIYHVIFSTTVILYVLNQKHVLPKPLSAIVSKVLFWPTLPITMSRRIGKWYTPINVNDNDMLVLGGIPLTNIPETLYKEYGVRGVINMCEEYKGPIKTYQQLGIEQLHLPTTDHFEPSFDDMQKAVAFIQDYEQNKKGKVYVHCKAGHGRSAGIVYAWLLSKQEQSSSSSEEMMKDLNERLFKQRNVRKKLWQQPNLKKFQSWLLQQQKEQ